MALYMPPRLNSKYRAEPLEAHSNFIKSQPAQPTAQFGMTHSGHMAPSQEAMGTIKWDEDLGALAASRLSLTQDIDTVKETFPAAYSQAKLMLERFTFQQSHYNVKKPRPIDMVIHSLARGPSFTDQWGKAWKDSRFDMMDFESIAPIEVHGHSVQMDTYDSVYSPYFFIFWEEECDDWKYMFAGVPAPCDPDILERLKQTCSSLASRYLKEGDLHLPPEHVYRPVASSGFDGLDDCPPEWELEYDQPLSDDFSPYMVAYRSIARKRPTEVRDIGVLTPGSLKCHRSFMLPLQRLVSRIPSCPHGRSVNFVKGLVSSFGSKNEYFFMRDYTKSGMTIPHQVIRAVFEGIYEDEPELMHRAISFYEKGVVMVDDDLGGKVFRKPQTGVPLGLFVEGYTILQYAIHEMVCQDLNMTPDQTGMFSATNDDMLFGSPYRHIVESYMDSDNVINSGLRMLVKFAKSGLSRDSFVYCEEYWKGGTMSKTSLFSLGILGAKYAVNIVHAKDLVNSLMQAAPSIEQVHLDAMREVQTHWGWEFSEQEWNWPYVFGGWNPQFLEGVDHSLDWYSGDFESVCAYWAARIKFYKKTELDEEPHLSLGRKIGIRLISEPENPRYWVDLVPLLGSKKTLKMHFGRLPPKAMTKRYNLIMKSRQERFQDMRNGTIEAPWILDGWYERHPNSVIREGMPNVVIAGEGDLIPRPKLGLSTQGLVGNLINMQAMGYITFAYPGAESQISKTEGMFFCHGVTKELNLKVIPIPRCGIAPDIFRLVPSDLMGFYERTGKFVVTLTGLDTFDFTRWWRFCPLLTCAQVRRIMNYFRSQNQEVSTYLLEFFQAQILHLQPNEMPEPSWWDQSETQAKALDSFLGKWKDQAPDILDDEGLQKILRDVATRMVPHWFDDHNRDVLHIADVNESIFLGGTSHETENIPDDGWQLPDEGYDIWESLEA
jgi:hypothetical protein